MHLSGDVAARFIVDVACRRGQGLGSVLEEEEDRMLIMAGTKDLAKSCSWHGASQHPGPACRVSNGRRPHSGVRVPQSFFTFKDLSFGALSDEVK